MRAGVRTARPALLPYTASYLHDSAHLPLIFDSISNIQNKVTSIPIHGALKSRRISVDHLYCILYNCILPWPQESFIKVSLHSGLVGVVGGGWGAMCCGGLKKRICTFHNSENVQIIFYKVREFYLLMFSFYFYCGSHEYWFSIFIK